MARPLPFSQTPSSLKGFKAAWYTPNANSILNDLYFETVSTGDFSVSVSDTFTITESITTQVVWAKASTLKEDFNSSIDSNIWINWGGAEVSFSSGSLQIINPINNTDYQGLITNLNYDLVNSEAKIRLIDAGNQSLVSFEVYFTAGLDFDNQIYFCIYGNNLRVAKKVSGVITNLNTVTYNSTNHQWLRFRETAGTLFWETSADGWNWTSQYSEATPINVSSVYIEMSSGTYANEASATTVIFDDYNTNAILVSDTISITESITVSLVGAVPTVNTSDTLSITEDVTVQLTHFVNVNDTITITEFVNDNIANRLMSAVSEDFGSGTIGIFSPINPSAPNSQVFTSGKAVLTLGTLTDDSSTGLREGNSNGAERGIDFTSGELIYQVTDADLSASGEYFILGAVVVPSLEGLGNVFFREAYLGIYQDSLGSEKVYWGTPTQAFTIPYNPLNHRWFRIRNNGTTWTFSHSIDRQTWVNFTDLSIDNPQLLNCVEFDFSIIAIASVGGPITVSLDNFNTPAKELADTISITEDVTVQFISNDAEASSVDTLTITESIAVLLVHEASVFESISITEDISVLSVVESSNVDTISITENVTVVLSSDSIQQDTLTINENINVELITSVTTSDTIIITEDIQALTAFQSDVFDTISISESVNLDLTASQNIFDSLVITEQTSTELTLSLSVFDAITITENTATSTDADTISFAVFDAVTLTEAFNSEVVIFVNVFDNINITEDIAFSYGWAVDINDTLTLNESVTTELTLNISVSDTLSITEAITISQDIRFEVFVEDIVTIGEFVQTENQLSIYLTDEVIVSETVLLNQQFNAPLIFSTIVLTDVVTGTDTIRFSPEPSKYRPRGEQNKIILRGDAAKVGMNGTVTSR